MQVREKVGKSRCTAYAQKFVAPEGKSRLANAAGAEPPGQMRDKKNCTPLWPKEHFQVNMRKAPHVRTTLGI